MEAERKRTSQAMQSLHQYEVKARNAEAMCRNLSQRMQVVSAQRGQLASSLDASLRQLGNSYNQNHKPKGPPFDPSPGSWGLLQELHQLHLKLHDVKPPLLGSPPRVAPP